MFELRKLPFEPKDVSGFLSDETCKFHYGKHHQNYVNTLNKLIKDTGFEDQNLFEIIQNSNGAIFNNAAQVYNHDFYWDVVAKKSAPSKEFLDAIEKKFGSFDEFKEIFKKEALQVFGSGWCWLAFNGQDFEIIKSQNASNPITENKVALLVVDVWEHAYYLDYQNARVNYLDKFMENINWEFVSSAYEWAVKENMDSVKFYIDDIHG